MSTKPIHWKNTLVFKEIPGWQNPVKYFEDLATDHDTFVILHDAINDLRNEGKKLTYVVGDSDETKELSDFLIVCDNRGVCYYCPVVKDDNGKIKHPLALIDIYGKNEDTAYLSGELVGSIDIDMDTYVETCSLGFEHASMTLLGKKKIRLDPTYTLVAVFHME